MKEKRLTLSFDNIDKKLILSEENIRRLTEWYGPDPKDWEGKDIQLYREPLKDVFGKVIGETIGMRQQSSSPESYRISKPSEQ